MKIWIAFGLAFCHGLCLAGVQPELTKRSLVALRTTSQPTIDGKLDDPCWKTASKAERFSDAYTGSLDIDPTTVWVTYDDQFIYVAFDCRDSDPKAIKAQETKRGASLNGDDRIALDIEPFNRQRLEEINTFLVNPLGTQETQIAGGRANKQEWQGAWKSAACIGPSGWTCEMAIPWSIMNRPPSKGGKLTMGLNFERVQQRTGVLSQWSNLGQNTRTELNGTWTGVQLADPKEPNKLSALWYAMGGVDKAQDVTQVGLDLRYKITPQQTALFTMNPDFSNVEGSVTSIDFSYAEKLTPETRPFFLEGGSYFSVGEGSTNGLVSTPYTGRRIPNIDLGAKFYGKLTPGISLGTLMTEDLSANRTDAMMHLRYKMGSDSFVSLIGVTRQEPGVDNQVWGSSGRFRSGDYVGYYNYNHSFDRIGEGDSGAIGAYWQAKEWSFYQRYGFVNETYLPRDGFMSYRNQRGYESSALYSDSWRRGSIRDLSVSFNWYGYDHYDGSLYRDGILTAVEARTAKDLFAYTIYSQGRYERYSDRVLTLGLNYPAQNKFRTGGISYSVGKQSGYTYESFTTSLHWKLDRRLSLGLSSEWVSLAGNDEQIIGTLSYDLAKDQAIGGRVVSHGDHTNAYLSYRKSGYGGIEYFVIYGDPNSETFKNRLIVKVVGVV